MAALGRRRHGPRATCVGLLAGMLCVSAHAQSEPDRVVTVPRPTATGLCNSAGECEGWGLTFRVTRGTNEIERRRAGVVDKIVLEALMHSPGESDSYDRGLRFDSMRGPGEPDLRMRPARD
jgi:hypothetical protein